MSAADRRKKIAATKRKWWANKSQAERLNAYFPAFFQKLLAGFVLTTSTQQAAVGRKGLAARLSD
jgi:hypothetical protein